MGVQDLRDRFKLAQYVLVTRVFTDPSAPAPAISKKRKAVSMCQSSAKACQPVAAAQLIQHCL